MNKCAFDLGNKCGALVKRNCAHCSFYKTREQVENGRKKSIERLGRIPNGINLYQKYYCGGKMKNG